MTVLSRMQTTWRVSQDKARKPAGRRRRRARAAAPGAPHLDWDDPDYRASMLVGLPDLSACDQVLPESFLSSEALQGCAVAFRTLHSTQRACC